MDIIQIRDMPTRLSEIGRIKIGRKGKMTTSRTGKQFQPPKKLEGFLVTTNERDEEGNLIPDKAIMRKLGDSPKEIPIFLLFDDIELNLQTRYVIYKGKKCICKGDGEQWFWLQENGGYKQGEKPEKQLDPKYKGTDRCKPTAVLSCVLADAEIVGGVWKFRTTGAYSVQAMMSSLKLISYLTGGHLAGIPLHLIATPTQKYDDEGKVMKFMVVTVVFKGAPSLLREKGLQLVTAGETYHRKLKQIETNARVELATKGNSFDDDIDETLDEFFPEISEEEAKKENSKNIIDKLSEKSGGNDKETEEHIDEAEFSEDDSDDEQDDIDPDTNSRPSKTDEKPEDDEIVDKEEDGQETKENGVVEETAEKTTLTPKDHLKVLLIEEGIDSVDLRATFYKKYPMKPEDYVKNIEMFKTNVDLFKKKLILSLVQGIPSMIDQLDLDERAKSIVKEKYESTDKNNFKDMMGFYADLKRGK